MKMKKRRVIVVLLLIVAALAVGVVAEDPPSLTDFQLFFGKVNNLPAGQFTLKAMVGANEKASRDVSGDGLYGQNPTFKVFANDGDTITFVVENSTGGEVQVGTHAYENKHVTEQNFDYPLGPGDVPADDDNDDDNETTGGDSSSRNRRSGGSSPAPNAFGFCLQSWHCTPWSTCSSGTQRRTCTQVDNCDVLLASGQVSDITETPKPSEQQSCRVASTASQGNDDAVCASRTKRCFGDELQACSSDGSSWETLQLCGESCDSFSLSCEEDLADGLTGSSSTSSAWPYYLGGSILFVVVIIILVLFIHREKKYGPAKEYIQNTRAKGFSDAQIRKGLIGQGWDSDKIEKLMK
jgi:hypothetical protein